VRRQRNGTAQQRGDVVTLGVLARFGLLPLPDQLHLLQNRGVIGVSSALFLIEFFATRFRLST
jgi:hypothetical protein